MNVEFCEDNSGTSKKMHYFRKNKGGGGGGGGGGQHFKVDPPLAYLKERASDWWCEFCAYAKNTSIILEILLASHCFCSTNLIYMKRSTF